MKIYANLTESMADWITFRASIRTFMLEPNEDTPLGITRIPVTLSDLKSRSTYLVNIVVIEPKIKGNPNESKDTENIK